MKATAADDRMRVQIASWRDELINLTRTNRLLYFRHTQVASLEILRPGMAKVFELIDRGRHWEFQQPAVDQYGRPTQGGPGPRANELVTDKGTPAQLAKSLRAVERRALDAFTERGLWTLYLGLGFLHWVDPKDGKQVETPLLLVPVEFARGSLAEPFRLRATDDDPILNPALVVKLSTELGVELPNLDRFEDVDPTVVCNAVAVAVAKQKGWTVQDRVVLHPFSFLKEAMYRDLLEDAVQIAAHPVVQALALGSEAPEARRLAFEPTPFEFLDVAVPPETLHHVCDADASQRRCVIAARDGQSFVMDGPPGTGKSQTITNIIAELLHAGKTVLFVSDKAAALEVVHTRLKRANLAEFALELHSHNATRKAIAHELGAALNRRPRAQVVLADNERHKLVRSRELLASYASVMNYVRQPLNRSLHQVLGRISELTGLLSPPAPKSIDLSLTPSELGEILEQAEILGRAWAPVIRADEYRWRDLNDRAISPSIYEERRRNLLAVQESMIALQERLDSLTSELGTETATKRHNVDHTQKLLRLIDERRDVPADWLTTEVHPQVDEWIQNLRSNTNRLNDLLTKMDADTAGHWRNLDYSQRGTIEETESALALPPLPMHLNDTDDQHTLATRVASLRDAANVIDQLIGNADELRQAFDVNAGRLDLELLKRLSQLAQLTDPVRRPEATWLDRARTHEVNEARSVLDTITAEVRSLRHKVGEVFKPTVIELDLASLRARFAELHKGLRKLGSAYRKDRDTLASHVLSGKVNDTVIDRLPEAITLQSLILNLRAAENQHATALGSYYTGEDTAFDRIDQALTVARAALELSGTDVEAAALQRNFAVGGAPDPRLVQIGQQVDQILEHFPVDLSELTRGRPVTSFASECRHAADLIKTVVVSLIDIETVVPGPYTLERAKDLLLRAGEATRVEENFELQKPSITKRFGPTFTGAHTNWDDVELALRWSEQIVGVLGKVASPEIAHAIQTTSVHVNDLAPLVERFDQAVQVAIAPFKPGRQEELEDEMSVSFADTDRLISDLYATVGEAEEWLRYDDSKRWLAAKGLGPVVQLCAERLVPGEQVAGVIERAVLERWVDIVMSNESARLNPLSSTDRDALVADFGALDRSLMPDSAALVINACAGRRPTTIVGETQIINREAEKLRKHMPIRTLLDRTGRAAQMLKPCFMMSPLSVSQYLPSDLLFDAVIFDEASQVRPSDAVNCVYRGRQLIVAGDQRQLPPTSFFQLGTTDTSDTYDEDELSDFQSVLDLAKASSALATLPLTWHYRSEHESLITYSNHSFYESSLTTFPSALQEADDVGIELFKVDGVYERGSARTNPIEAAKVVERVLFHRTHHPHLTLGVIAFSAAQQECIENAVEEASMQHPELLGLLGEDRLDGFFVKNLENVQGDERDLIIFSIGYGPNEEGKVSANFGPLIKAGGWRRLNVAITRARRRVEVISSFLPNQLSSTTANEGIKHLRGYLEFARAGELVVGDGRVVAEPLMSHVADDLAEVLRRWGYTVDRNVGNGALRLDIGIRHPARNGEYLIGVECDGEGYSSTWVTRDRDRLRDQVLAGLGWRLHRVWSTAWFRDRAVEERRLRDAINNALNGADTVRRRTSVDNDTTEDDSGVEVSHQFHLDDRPPWAQLYTPWDGDEVRSTRAPHDPDERSRLKELLGEIVRSEGPIAIGRVVRVVRLAWPTRSGGSKTTDAVEAAIRTMIGRTFVTAEPGFIAFSDQQTDVVRLPDPDDARTKRTVEEVPWSELIEAVRHIVNEGQTVTLAELATSTARLFGWGRTGVHIETAVHHAVKILVDSGDIERNPDSSISAI